MPPIRIPDLHWAAGFLEGEGSFRYLGTCHVEASQSQKWPLIKLQNTLGSKVTGPKRSYSHLSKQDIYNWRRTGPSAAGILMTLYTLMSPKKQSQIKDVLIKWRKIPLQHSPYSKVCKRGHPKIYPNWVKRKGRNQYYCKECQRINNKYRYNIPKISRNSNQLRLQIGGIA